MRPAAPLPLIRATFGVTLAFSAVAGLPALAAPGGPTATSAPQSGRGQADQKLRPSFAEDQMALALRRRAARDWKGALAAAREAASAFDAQVELHKALSEALPALDDARAERATALTLGLRRDEAFELVAELAEATHDLDLAVRHYVMLVQSQADQPRGHAAYAALRRLRWAATPVPPSPAPRP